MANSRDTLVRSNSRSGLLPASGLLPPKVWGYSSLKVCSAAQLISGPQVSSTGATTTALFRSGHFQGVQIPQGLQVAQPHSATLEGNCSAADINKKLKVILDVQQEFICRNLRLFLGVIDCGSNLMQL